MSERLVIATDDEKARTPLSYPVPLSVLLASRQVAKD